MVKPQTSPWLIALAVLTGILCQTAVAGNSAAPQLLVFSATEGFRHSSISAAHSALTDLASNNGFSVDITEDPTVFSAGNLSNYDAVAFVLTSGDVLNNAQQSAFEGYIRAGGGFVGVHSASDTEYSWPWYGQLIGAYFDRHPAQQDATVTVEDNNHPSTTTLPTSFSRFDEWYDFQTNPRPDVNVLLTVDEDSYNGGQMGPDHPIAWYQEFDGGRSFYTAMGHTSASYSEPTFVAHLLGGVQYALGGSSGGEGPLTVDTSGQWFIRRDSGRPVFMAGVGGPEGFLYESDARKQEIVDDLVSSGANALYMHSIRSFEGDGFSYEDPFNINEDETSGIAPGVFDNWMTYLTQLDQAGIVTWFHVIDDTARPWGCSVPLSQDAVDYIEALVTTFRGLDNLVWLAGEEYLMGSCSTGEDNDLMSAIAAEIRRHDPVHPIGVHHNNGQSMQFGTDPNVNVFAQQICGNSALRSPAGVHSQAEQGSWVYVMSECHPWHLNLLHDGDRTNIRQSNWGSAMGGGYVLLYNAYECAHAGRLCSRNASGDPTSANDPHDPTTNMLGDLRRLREFMESAAFNTLTPRDNLAAGDTLWALANTSTQNYILYDLDSPATLGVEGLAPGQYTLTWFDPASGQSSMETRNASDAPFAVPGSFGAEVALHLAPSGTIENRPPLSSADSYSTGEDETLTVAAPGVLDNDSDLDGDPITAVLIDQANSGSVTLAADGGFSYTPNGGFTGSDTFTYQATDSTLNSPTTSVTISVGQSTITVQLVNAGDDSDAGLLENNQTLLLSSLGFSEFSVRTDNVPAGTASIEFTLTGPVATTRVENVAPYSLFGDTNGNFAGETLNPGNYLLQVSAFGQANAAGDALATVTVSFTVTNSAELIFSDGFE
ncbi:MAG: ThuA domain-containing protein [Lysobacterales bacterium]